jgi:hypothetical protein
MMADFLAARKLLTKIGRETKNGERHQGWCKVSYKTIA